ncbi:ribosome silencing factor [Neptuniibacter caesariensis]|uniref:Ribosomal silencing factor RsfS n=1 Tax=Neptuniibacter caesariensis TaxID=207954 RepID=A0A7U8GU04_NEPCE|nr:ribosome silencing factor [Neptuniibacter caesariensis]EAR62981.1 hypothetical protein MED92_07676 [Oceanospirillum sp. MED92] [Neptuniibacter caesariensis]
MQTEKILELVHGALEDMKAKEITDLDVRGRSTVTDYMIIASGTSKRHVAAVAEEVVVKVKEAGLMPLGSEGQGASDWILVDLGDVVVHVMMPDARSFYDLERLWGVDADA